MANDIANRFLDDTPKSNPWRDDALGYRDFADRLATALNEIDAPSGYVVGLHGAWGSGKSSVLNFVEAFLTKRRDECEPGYASTEIVRFEPWIVSGHQDLAAAFFKQLSLRIADGIAEKDARKKRVAKTLKLGLDPAIDAAAKIGAALDHTGGILSKGAAAASKKGVNAAIDRWLAEPSLQSTYEQLSKRLSTFSGRYIVMIDDIDRLTSEEIRVIMQMVKTVGKLPRVIYLLAYDREVVWAALRELDASATRRPEYAEKIIQHEVELPVPSVHSLLRLLDAETAYLPSPPSDSTRWFEMLHAGVLRWIKHPRDVSRLSNALKFSWPALDGEMDPQDLMCMEGLRLFERPVYEWIKQNRDILLGEGRARLMLGDDRVTSSDRLWEVVAPDDKDVVQALLLTLFPNKSELIAGKKDTFGGEAWYEVAARRGMATKQGFDAYFSLNPSPTVIPKSLVDNAMTNLEDEDVQISCIQYAIERKDEYGNTLVGDYFRELKYRFDRQDAVPSQALINALVVCERQIDDLEWSGDIFSPSSALRNLRSSLFEDLDSDFAATLFETALSRATSLNSKAGLLVEQARNLELLPGRNSSRRPAISKDRFSRLTDNLLIEIEKAANSGKLDSERYYYPILRLWAYFGNDKAARAWIGKVALSSGKQLAQIIDGLVWYSRSQSGKSYSVHELPDPKMYDHEQLREALDRHFEDGKLSDDELRKIEVLRDALSRSERFEDSEEK